MHTKQLIAPPISQQIFDNQSADGTTDYQKKKIHSAGDRDKPPIHKIYSLFGAICEHSWIPIAGSHMRMEMLSVLYQKADSEALSHPAANENSSESFVREENEQSLCARIINGNV